MIGLISGIVLIYWVRTLKGDHGAHMTHYGASIMMIEVYNLPELGRGINSYLRDALLIVGIGVILRTFVQRPRGPLELLTLMIWRDHELLLLREPGNPVRERLIQLAVMMLGGYFAVKETTLTLTVGRPVFDAWLLLLTYLIPVAITIDWLLNTTAVNLVTHCASFEPRRRECTRIRDTLQPRLRVLGLEH
jgi:hypothetical protein